MITWASFRNQIRIYLKDDQDTAKYSDQLLYLFTVDAIKDYSQWFPREVRVEIEPVDGVYPVPEDMIDIRVVEYPEGTYLKSRIARPGRTFRNLASPTLYWKEGGSIHINAVAKGPLFLTYGGLHAYPTSDSDDAFQFTVPLKDMELINIYVRAKCLEQTRSRQSSLDRFKRRGSRDDNPMMPETTTLMDEYYNKIAERSRGGVIYLYGV